MSDSTHFEAKGIPTATPMRMVMVDAARAEHLPATGLFQSTAKEFNRVRNSYPWFDRLVALDRAYQSMRGRDFRPIEVLHVNGAERLVSPVAELSDGTGAYCITVASSLPDSYYGPDIPYVAMLGTDMSKLELHRAQEQYLDVGNIRDDVGYFGLESLGTLTEDTALSQQQRVGLAAVYLGLKVSSSS